MGRRGSANDELLRRRLDHVSKEWFDNEHFFLSILVKEGIKTWYDYVDFVVNLDEINAMKNRNRSGSSDEDDIDEYDGYIPPTWRRLMLYSLSYVNELQIEKGVSNNGLVDITGVTIREFDNYIDGCPPIIKVFTNDLAREHAAKVERREQELRRVQLEADAAQAKFDIAWDKAYGQSGARTNSSRSSRGSVNTPRPNKSENFSYGPSRQEQCVDTDGVEDNPFEAGDNSSEARDNLPSEAHFYTGLGFTGGKTQSTSRSLPQQSQDSSHGGHVPFIGSLPSSKPSSKRSKKKKKKKKPYGGGGDGGSSGGSSDSSGRTSSIPSHISTSIPDSKSGRSPYRGAYRKHQPRSKLKFDPTCFPQHSDQTAWTTYAHGFAAVLKSFNMQELIDPTFRPIARHKEAFKLDNSTLYYILNSTVKSHKGREFVLSEADTFDGQKVWTKMAQYYSGSGSIAAEHAKNEVYNRINTPLDVHSKRVRLVPTIAKWETDVTEFMLRSGTPLLSKEKFEMFKRFISGVKELDNVVSLSTLTQSIVHSRGGGSRTLSPDELLAAYKQEASMVDARNKRDMVSRRHQIVNECRNVNHTRAAYQKAGYEINTIDFGGVTDDKLDDDQWYDVMMSSLGERRKGFLPGDAHRQLTPEEKKYWEKFSEESKELIMTARGVPNVKPPPRRRNGGDAFRSNTSRVPNTPVAQGATANVTEQSQVNNTEVGYDDLASIPADAPEVQANYAELWENVYNVNMTSIQDSDDFRQNGTEFIDLLEKNREVNETHFEVNQTSELEPFRLPRFLSQPKKKSTTPRVTFADESVSEMGSEAKADSVSQSGSVMKVDSISQPESVTTIDIQFHDIQSDDGTTTQLLVPSNCLTQVNESRKGNVCKQEGKQLDEVSQELSPAQHKSVPYNISFTGSSILDAWQESYPIGTQDVYDANTHLTDGSSEKIYGEDTDTTELIHHRHFRWRNLE